MVSPRNDRVHPNDPHNLIGKFECHRDHGLPHDSCALNRSVHRVNLTTRFFLVRCSEREQPGAVAGSGIARVIAFGR